MKNYLSFTLVVFGLITGCVKEEQGSPDVKLYEQDRINVNLNEKFLLVENQTASIESENLQLLLTKIIYSPCPKGAMCIWSGLGAEIEVSTYDQINTTMLSIEGSSTIFSKFKIDLMEVTPTYVGFKVTTI